MLLPLLGLWVVNVHLGGSLNDSPLGGIDRLRALRTPSPAGNPTHRLGQATALVDRALETSDRRLRDREIAPLEAALAAAAPPTSPEVVLARLTLDSAYRQRLDERGEESDVDAGVANAAALAQLMEAGAAVDPLDRVMAAAMHARWLVARHDQRPAMADLDSAIAVLDRVRDLDRATAEGPDGVTDGLLWLALRRRFETTDNLRDLQRCLEVGRVLHGTDSAAEPDVDDLVRHCMTLQLAYERLGRAELLDEAVTVAEQAVARASVRQLAPALSELAVAHSSRFVRDGDRRDIDRAVALLSDGLARAADAAAATLISANLAVALRVRHDWFGASRDLDESIRHGHTALGADVEIEGRNQEKTAVNLAQAYLARAEAALAGGRAERTGRDLDAAVSALRHSLPEVAADPIATSTVHAALAQVHETRWLHLRGPQGAARAALDQAVDHANQAARLPADHPLWPQRVADRCRLLLDRYQSGGPAEDLDLALDCLSRAEQQLTGRASHPLLDATHGAALALQYRRSPAHGLAGRAIELLGRAGADRSLPVASRMQCLAQLGEFTAGELHRFDLALAAYDQAVQLLPALAHRANPRGDNELQLAAWPGLACDAAACAIQTGDPRRALELLELGRGVLWRQLLHHDDDAGRLAAVDPALARRFAHARAALQQPVRAGSQRPGVDDGARAAERWEEVLTEIRARPGLHDFLRPVPAEVLLRGLPAGPVIVINTSRWRCDAVVITAGAVTVVPLALDRADLTRRSDEYLAAMNVEHGTSAAAQAESTVSAVLDWLWWSSVAPVAAALLAAGPPPRRVWWCPTGLLTVLPVHAACPSADTEAGRAWQRVVPSYTPTLSTLAAVNSPVGSRAPFPAAPSVLSVLMPETPGMSPLPNVDREQRALDDIHPGRTTTLRGSDATRSAVRQAWKHHDRVHFGCHGVQDLDDPSRGGLQLADGILDVTSLLTERIDHDLVYLSACQTALGGVTNADEVITLAAALHHAGGRHIVGTLWSVHDSIAARVARSFYRELSRARPSHPEQVAAALHLAVRDVAGSAPQHPRAWSLFVHIGP